MNISEVSKKMDISADTLRYYEKIGIIPRIERSNGGIRQYDEHDLNWIYLAKCMRKSGLSIDALTQYLKLFQQGEYTQVDRLDILIEQKKILIDKIQQMENTLQLLNKKINLYESSLKQKTLS